MPPIVDGKLLLPRHIEVKGRVAWADTVTITRSEIVYGLNQGDKFVLAIVQVGEDDSVEALHYIRQPFDSEPAFDVASINYNLAALLAKGSKFNDLSDQIAAQADRSGAAARRHQRSRARERNRSGMVIPARLHLWWARRPLAAARAVLFAQLVNDPGYQQGDGFKYGVNKEEATKEREAAVSHHREVGEVGEHHQRRSAGGSARRDPAFVA